ncbi:MAG: IPT/TIG domain-containing protein [Treponema sp.]|nr:IPT/TIG domain-containing protein [Treponema sp.]
MSIKHLSLFLTIFILFFSCSADTPTITSIDPKIGRMGEVITLRGSNFGASREESYVTIAGISPTNSSYYLWHDDIIMVRVPELGESGLVYVHVKGERSNGMLFSNTLTVPRPAEGEELGFDPRIISVTPQTGIPGSIITITGSNFGVSRDNLLQAAGGVFFSWDFESGSNNPFVVKEPEFIEVSEIELGYESWSSREIRVRVPDGAVSGNLEIRTPHGSSRPVFFDVSEKPGNKIFKDKRSYSITYSVDIRVNEASRPNTLYLWIPKPITSPSQRNVNLLSRNTEPFAENYRGVDLFKLENLGTGNQSVNLSFLVDVYAVETRLNSTSIRQERTPLYTMYTQNTRLIPSDNQQIRSTVNTIIGREVNPYNRGRAIYDWIIRNVQITDRSLNDTDIITAFEQRNADTYTAAMLFTTMARAAGLPCIPIAGVLIDRNGQTVRHYWTEFWIDGIGWIPVDPAMGAGAVTISDNAYSIQNPANYYFGNIDNQRIAFSRENLSFRR